MGHACTLSSVNSRNTRSSYLISGGHDYSLYILHRRYGLFRGLFHDGCIPIKFLAQVLVIALSEILRDHVSYADTYRDIQDVW